MEPGGAVVPAGAAGGADPDRGGTAAFVARGVDGRGARKPKASLLLWLGPEGECPMLITVKEGNQMAMMSCVNLGSLVVSFLFFVY